MEIEDQSQANQVHPNLNLGKKGSLKTSIIFEKSNLVGKTSKVMADEYEVIKQLGKGGYGSVYEVKNKTTGDIRACKHLSKANIKNLEKFEREIAILMEVDHPSIVKLYEVYESTRSLYLIMQICRGGELFDKIIEHMEKKQMYTEKEAATIIMKVASAICYCHNKGICHRDIKPENVLYLNAGDEKNNPIKVIDFGLSQTTGHLGTKVGTAYYVSPEVLMGKYTEKCDIWSLGVILFILLSGDPPFNGPNDNVIYKKVAKMHYKFEPAKWEGISSQAIDLIKHMLVPEDVRFSAGEVLAHPWFDSVKNITLTKKIEFNLEFLKDYAESTKFKKLAMMYIASRLNEDEIRELAKIFAMFDAKKDGQIDYEEFKNALTKLENKEINEDELKQIYNGIDTDKNHKIDYTEFIAAIMSKKVYLKKEKLSEAFSALDLNGDGTVTKEELMQVLKVGKENEQKIDEFISKIDTNKDGKIDYIEFIKMMGEDIESLNKDNNV